MTTRLGYMSKYHVVQAKDVHEGSIVIRCDQAFCGTASDLDKQRDLALARYRDLNRPNPSLWQNYPECHAAVGVIVKSSLHGGETWVVAKTGDIKTLGAGIAPPPEVKEVRSNPGYKAYGFKGLKYVDNPAADAAVYAYDWPKANTYDGLTAEQCLERYKINMKYDAPLSPGLPSGATRIRWSLTPKQKAKAQEMWTAELRVKTKASETKARDQVRVDLEYEEWE